MEDISVLQNVWECIGEDLQKQLINEFVESYGSCTDRKDWHTFLVDTLDILGDANHNSET